MNSAHELTLTLWQCGYADDTARALQRLEIAASQASHQGAALLVCPEMSLTGYAIGPDNVKALAESADGPLSKAVADVARRHRLAIVYGFPQRHPDGALPFNTVQMIDADGQRLAHYAKTHLFGEVDRAQFSPGPDAPAVFTWRGWRLGLLICYDVEFPEAARLLGLQGADLVLVPTANMRAFDNVPQLLVPARACENRLWLAYANACGQDAMFDYGGLSTVASPQGAALARAGREEALLTATLNLGERRDALSLGQWPSRRPDLYRMLTDAASVGGDQST